MFNYIKKILSKKRMSQGNKIDEYYGGCSDDWGSFGENVESKPTVKPLSNSYVEELLNRNTNDSFSCNHVSFTPRKELIRNKKNIVAGKKYSIDGLTYSVYMNDDRTILTIYGLTCRGNNFKLKLDESGFISFTPLDLYNKRIFTGGEYHFFVKNKSDFSLMLKR